MKKYDVIIIGAGPAGIITGVTAKKQNPDKSILMIREEEKGLVLLLAFISINFNPLTSFQSRRIKKPAK